MSFIKWCGGKQRLAKQIINEFPKDYDIYCEVFLGGGSIFFELKPKKAILADNNPNLINTFLVVKDNIGLLKEQLSILDKIYNNMEYGKSEERKKFYYKIRDEFNLIKYHNGDLIASKNLTEKINIASYFIFLNKSGYNGMYRENKNGKFNIPIGDYKYVNIYNEQTLDNCSKILNEANADIRCIDCFSLLRELNSIPNILYYLDPPYYVCDESKFKSYTKDEFTNEHQIKLANILLNNHHSFFLSNSDCNEIRKLYPENKVDKIINFELNRTINGHGNRNKAKEVFIFKNYLPSFIS